MRAGRAFTLVELLVVIAVLGLLAAIIVPSFTIARARGDAARCLGNLRSLGTALNLYLGENQMTMPPLAAGRKSKSEDIPVIDNTLDRYLDSAAVFVCPAGRKIAEESGTSYYWNSALSGQAFAGLNFFNLTSDLGRIPVLVDKEGWHKHTEDRVNHLFADGHATKELRLFAE